jgi:hypothetical protein
MRVAKAVVEYVAAKSRAARITVAEGGTSRHVGDPAPENDGGTVEGIRWSAS